MGKLDLMKKGLLSQKQEELGECRTRIRRLVDDIRVHTFYKEWVEPEKLNIAAVCQAAEELEATIQKAESLRQEIEELRK